MHKNRVLNHVEYKLPRQEISEKLSKFCAKKVKENKIYVPATRKNLAKLAKILEKIKEDGLPEYLVLKKLEHNLGHGIFLHPEADPILKGEFIAPYSGKVFLFPQNEEYDSDYMFTLLSDLRLTMEEQQEWNPDNAFHPRRLYSVYLDADKKGNFTRFINHSGKPNIEATFLRIPTNSVSLLPSPCEIIYTAKKNIQPGEQLLVSYEGEEKSYWGPMKIKPFPMTPQTFQITSSLELVSK